MVAYKEAIELSYINSLLIVVAVSNICVTGDIGYVLIFLDCEIFEKDFHRICTYHIRKVSDYTGGSEFAYRLQFCKYRQ